MGNYNTHSRLPFAKRLLSLLIALFLTNIVAAQNTNNEQLLRSQRAIFIYNFAQQVGGWPNFSRLSEFTIAVLGNDRTTIDLTALSKKRRIQNKRVEIININSLDQLKGVELLYVNRKFNFNIESILNKIGNKNILLITEDYNFNSSMINMINVGNSFEYEINSARLLKEGFNFTPSLKEYAVSTSEKWKALYKEAEQSLNSARETEAKKEQLLRRKEEQILSQEQVITNQKGKIDTSLQVIFDKNEKLIQLGERSALQQKKYEEKVLIEQQLEKNIEEQIKLLKEQQTKITSSNQEIEYQLEILNKKAKEIQTKDEILLAKNSELSARKKVNILLIVLCILILLAGLFFYRNYRIKKRLNLELDRKNIAIQKQAKLLIAKNEKLEQFNYIATHDLKLPISNLEGYYSFLKEDLKTDDTALLDTIHWIGKSIDQAKFLITDLIQVIEMDTKPLDREILYFEAIITEILDGLSRRIEMSKALIEFDFDKCSRVNYDKVELKSILQNLISNALKYRSPDRPPVIKISAAFKGEFVLLIVADNGLGIDLDLYEQDLFSPFKRIHTHEEGNGIGLYMIKNMIENSGGKVEVKSEVGVGTEFLVYLKRGKNDEQRD